MVETHAAALAAALEGAKTAYATRNPRSERLQHEAAKVMPGCNTRSVLLLRAASALHAKRLGLPLARCRWP